MDDLVVKMKEAVAMDIRIEMPFVGNATLAELFRSISPNNESISAAKKARLRLSAISMSSEQSRTVTTGDSVWLGIGPYAALYTLGRQVFAKWSGEVVIFCQGTKKSFRKK